MKVCSTCLLPKSLDAFTNNKLSKDGKDYSCRICRNIRKAAERRAKGISPRPLFLEKVWNNIEVCIHGDTCPFCCWPWRGVHVPNGYGHIGIRHTFHMLASHVVYAIWNARPIPKGLLVLHYCDVPSCTNPHHLWLGTYRDNNHDRNRKGRANMPHGETHCMAKVSAADVMTIRALHAQGFTAREIQKRYPIALRTVFSIIKRTHWKHI